MTKQESAVNHYHTLLIRAGFNRRLSDESKAWRKIDESAIDLAWLLAFGIDGNGGQRYRARIQAAK